MIEKLMPKQTRIHFGVRLIMVDFMSYVFEMIKKILLTVIIIILAETSWSAEKVRIAFFQAQPHIFYSSSTKTVYGALHTFLEQYIAPHMQVEFVWDTLPSNVPRQIKLLENDMRDAAALMIFVQHRSRYLTYTSNKFSTAKPVLGVLESNPLETVERVEDILYLKIGYAAENYLSPFMRDKRILFDFVSSPEPNEINLKKLKARRIDAVYMPDKAALLSELIQLNLEDTVRVIELPEGAAALHVVFSKGNRELAEKYDKAFQEVNGENVYRELLKKYLNEKRP